MRIAVALGVIILSPIPLASAAALNEGSARVAFLEASLAGDQARMKAFMLPSVTSIDGETLSADEFLRMIEGCRQTFAGKALVSWKCEDDRSRVVSVSLRDGPRRVSLSELSVIALWPAPASGEE